MHKLLLFPVLLAWCLSTLAGEPGSYSPLAGVDYPTRLFWGDTHLHSNNSPDAYTFGNTGIDPEKAYRFARGDELKLQSGEVVQLREPLDFLVVADHAEFLGIFRLLDSEDPVFLQTGLGKYWHGQVSAGNREVVLKDFINVLRGGKWGYRVERETYRSIWDTVTRLADMYYQPGQFTTFSGYEWTSMPGGNNLHRVIIFRDDAEKVTRIIPFSALDSDDPEDLWQFLAEYEKNTGGEVLAIPHNPNVSNGLMFSPRRLHGGKLDAGYARLRSRWEPLLEVTQMKGDSEVHPLLSPADEFADFENWDSANIDNSVPKEEWMLQYEYARSALKMGLEYQHRLAANPFKFGMIGSTDSHTGLATTDEDNFYGKFPVEGPSPKRTTHRLKNLYDTWRLGVSGLAAVWAHKNSRESLFAAFKRREVYATTGPRIVLRFFAGWDFLPDDIYRPDYVATGYRKGVPMGGDLTAGAERKAPRFLVTAARSPHGANLDRIQIIKGWLDGAGKTQEQIYNVALSDGRSVDPVTGGAPSVPNTVIVSEAQWSNSTGAASLAAYWRDPDFNPEQPAFYYARVLEIPTPRWTAYDAKIFNLDLPDEIPMWQQERAYSSPVWYTP